MKARQLIETEEDIKDELMVNGDLRDDLESLGFRRISMDAGAVGLGLGESWTKVYDTGLGSVTGDWITLLVHIFSTEPVRAMIEVLNACPTSGVNAWNDRSYNPKLTMQLQVQDYRNELVKIDNACADFERTKDGKELGKRLRFILRAKRSHP